MFACSSLAQHALLAITLIRGWCEILRFATTASGSHLLWFVNIDIPRELGAYKAMLACISQRPPCRGNVQRKGAHNIDAA